LHVDRDPPFFEFGMQHWLCLDGNSTVGRTYAVHWCLPLSFATLNRSCQLSYVATLLPTPEGWKAELTSSFSRFFMTRHENSGTCLESTLVIFMRSNCWRKWHINDHIWSDWKVCAGAWDLN
jgi:hypothetical protein